MSDIPDWLVELAAQRDDEEETATSSPEAAETTSDEVQEEWDFLRASPAVAEDTAVTRQDSAIGAGAASVPAVKVDEGEIISALRSQVEADVLAPGAASLTPMRTRGTGIAGLLPWQQAVLAILLLLDIAVIGLLFLVMLGKMSIG